jgi:hypothetical protein
MTIVCPKGQFKEASEVGPLFVTMGEGLAILIELWYDVKFVCLLLVYSKSESFPRI